MFLCSGAHAEEGDRGTHHYTNVTAVSRWERTGTTLNPGIATTRSVGLVGEGMVEVYGVR